MISGNSLTNDLFLKVQEFNTRMQVTPDIHRAASMINEELDEFMSAAEDFFEDPYDVKVVSEFLKETSDVVYVVLGLADMCDRLGINPQTLRFQEALVGKLSLFDQTLTRIDAAVTEHIIYECVCVVHDSNMSKLDDDGNPIFREDGKVMKGPNYRKADMTPYAEQVIDNITTLEAEAQNEPVA